LRQILSQRGFRGVLDRTGLTSLPIRFDLFLLPIERLSPTEAVLPVSETGLTGFRCQQLGRVCFYYVCRVDVGCVLLLGLAALQWLRGLVKRSLWRRTSEIRFIVRVLE
jgi:hypothetical protein